MTNYVDFPEADWRTLRNIKETLLQRASTRALECVEKIIASREADPHKSYLELWRVLRDEDKAIGRMFDDLRRSNARLKLSEMIRNKLLTPEEITAFTADTRDWIIEMSALTRRCS